MDVYNCIFKANFHFFHVCTGNGAYNDKKMLFISKLSVNFNYNLVESWDSINFIFHTHPQEKFKKHSSLNFNFNFGWVSPNAKLTLPPIHPPGQEVELELDNLWSTLHNV